MKNDTGCPVDLIPINENKVRLVALLVLILGIVYIASGWWGIIVFLVFDFLLRSFDRHRYSPLAILAGAFVNLFNIGIKPTDQAPKRFAARMGLVFTSVILVLSLFQFTGAVIILSITLCVFAFLESFVSFCAGCYIYSFYYKLIGKKRNIL